LKGARSILVSALVQLTFYRYNSYWVKWRRKANDFIQHGKIWPPTIEIESTMSSDRLRDYTAMLFDSEQKVFQVNTLIKLGVIKEVRRAVTLNDRTCTCGKGQAFQRSCSHVIKCCAKSHIDFI
jgi:hypothetical protein